MNILLIAYYHDMPNRGGAIRTRAVARVLRAAGHRVFVVTAGFRGDRREGDHQVVHDPSRNGDRRGVNYFRWLARRLAVEAVLRCGGRASIYAAWRRRVERRAGEILAAAAPDVILASYPPAEDLLLGLAMARRSGVPLVADFRDGLMFEPLERRSLAFAAVRRAYRRLEARLAREATAMVTVSPAISRYFREELGCRRVATVANGFDPEAPLSPMVPSPFVPGRFHALHTGSVALSDRGCDIAPFVRGVERALEEAPELRPRLLLHFAGRLDGRERRLLRPLAAAGVARLHGQLPRETAMWMQRQADLLLLLTAPDRASVATAKLFEYMQARRPVLALASGNYAAAIIAETGIGWTIPPNDADALAAALATAARGDAPPLRFDEEAIRRYDQQRQIMALLRLLEEART